MPQQIGRYEIRAELGRGGMATVYRAYDPRFTREVAVKVLPREFLHDAQFRARFEREARTIATLEHPAIVPVYDFGEEDEQPYIVMRLMTGGSLADRLAHGPLSLLESARIFGRLAPALDRAHSKGVIHRDLKPGNILFDDEDNPYVSDFGIAKITEASTVYTHSGGIVGTPAYMSPEQARGDRDIDNRSDIYALGAILYEMLTGRLPYEADTPMGIAVKHITEPPPRVSEARPDLPHDCDAMIQRAMAKSRDNRYPTANGLAEALTAAVSSKTTPPRARAQSLTLKSAGTTVSADAASQRSSRPAPEGKPRARNVGILIGVAVVIGACLVTGVGAIIAAPQLGLVNQPRVTPTSEIDLVIAGETGTAIAGIATARAGETQIAAANLTATFQIEPSVTQPAPTSTTPPTRRPTDPPTATRTTLPTSRPSASDLESLSLTLTAFAAPPATATAPAPPVSRTIQRLFTQRIGSQADIFIEYSDGSIVNITDHPAQDDYAALSPNGAQIAFSSTRNGPAFIFVMNVDGTGVRQITSGSSGDNKPEWSADGAQIYFTRYAGGTQYERYVVNIDGSNVMPAP
jgi:serine/threonine-protein kinase